MTEATPFQSLQFESNEDDKELKRDPGSEIIDVSYKGSTNKSLNASKVKIADVKEFASQIFPPELRTQSCKSTDMSKCLLTPRDTNDPSYTNLTLPYSVVSRQRYRAAGAKQKAQFRREIMSHELLQNKALDGVRIHREFCNPILRHPKPEEMIKLTSKQKARIEKILSRTHEP